MESAERKVIDMKILQKKSPVPWPKSDKATKIKSKSRYNATIYIALGALEAEIKRADGAITEAVLYTDISISANTIEPLNYDQVGAMLQYRNGRGQLVTICSDTYASISNNILCISKQIEIWRKEKRMALRVYHKAPTPAPPPQGQLEFN